MLNPSVSVSSAGHDSVSIPSVSAAPARASSVLKRIDSLRLLGGGRELVIEHSGQEYRLRLTRNDKLILTK